MVKIIDPSSTEGGVIYTPELGSAAKPTFRARLAEKARGAARLGVKIGKVGLVLGGAALGVKAGIDSAKAHVDAAKTIAPAIAKEGVEAAKHAAADKVGLGGVVGNPQAAASAAFLGGLAKIDPIGLAHHLENPAGAQPKLPPVPKVGVDTSGSGSAGLHIVSGKPQTYGPALPPELSGKKAKFKGKFQKLKPKLPKKLKKKKK